MIRDTFLPVKIHVKQQPETFAKFGDPWTPTIMIAEPDGTERYRFEGYLPAQDYIAQLRLGLAHAARARGEWTDAERSYRALANDKQAGEVRPEALYWAGVSKYRGGDQSALADTARLFREMFPESNWAKKASVWES